MLRAALAGLVALITIVFAGPEAALFVVERSPLAAGLPDGEDLDTLLSSCQITSEFGPEATLCPQALAANAFSSHLHTALVASEDRRFLAHDGVDPWAVLRVGFGMVGLAEATGGSTVSQQLARTLFLSREPSYRRKLREWILARRIERVADKGRILTAYLNVAPLGHGLFGFDAAASYFLGKPARDVSPMEAALLVSMLPRPVREPAKERIATYRATIARIDRMQSERFLDAETALAAKAEARTAILHGGLPEVSQAARHRARRPFEHRRVRDLANRQLDEQGIAPDEAVRLFVTLDPRFQRWSDRAANAVPEGHDAAVVFLSPTGNVLAVAGPPYAATQYNAAFQANRSVGSLGKVPLYVLAHERPDLLQRLYSTAPLRGDWPAEPSARCTGEVPLDRALSLSCNRPFARLSAELPQRSRAFLDEIGLAAPDNPVLTGLGGAHGDLLTMSSFFAAIANGGRLVAPRALVAAADRAGTTRFAGVLQPTRRIMPRETADAVAADLRGPVRDAGGTARRAAGKARAALVSGKTGTSDGNRDAWFVGFTHDFVGGIWAYATRADAPAIGGGGYPAAAFGEIVDRYWVPRNARAAGGGAAPTQSPVFRWTLARTRHQAETLARPLALLALLGFCIARLRKGAGGGAERAKPRLRAAAATLFARLSHLVAMVLGPRDARRLPATVIYPGAHRP